MPKFFFYALILFFGSLGFFLRINGINISLQSSDNADVPYIIIRNHFNLDWLLNYNYGITGPLFCYGLYKVFSYFNFEIHEWLWRLPIFLTSIITPVIVYRLCRNIGLTSFTALLAFIMLNVLPIYVDGAKIGHFYQSYGCLFSLLSFYLIYVWIDKPSIINSQLVSVVIALNLFSHIFIFPSLILYFFSFIFIFVSEKRSLYIRKFFSHGVLFWPLITVYFWKNAIYRALFEKKTVLGWYLDDYLWIFINNFSIGLILIWILASILLIIWYKYLSVIEFSLYLVALAYLLPIILLVPPGITVITSYIVGAGFFLCVVSALIIGKTYQFGGKYWKAFIAGYVLLCITHVTIADINAFLLYKSEKKSLYVKLAFTNMDRGTRQISEIINKYTNQDIKILAIHRSIERNVWDYYFKRKADAFQDLTLEKTLKILSSNKVKKFDLVVSDPHEQSDVMKKNLQFEEWFTFRYRDIPRMVVWKKKNLSLPIVPIRVNDTTFMLFGIFPI